MKYFRHELIFLTHWKIYYYNFFMFYLFFGSWYSYTWSISLLFNKSDIFKKSQFIMTCNYNTMYSMSAVI